MTADGRNRIDLLAARVAEGDAIDWDAEEAQASGPEELRAIRGLRLLAEVGAVGATVISDDSSPAPRSIGPYRLVSKLGEGGMGEVWEAEQTEPVRRRVAVKIVKLGMDTERFVARFDAERQALALMDHPGIARIFDAGATETGRPYMVMELVRGLPITEHCDRHRLGTIDRLMLFRQVCDAVQHAHQKAVLHRDLKPSNVLVAMVDGKPVPKVIDFGVAKALGARLTDRTLFTEAGQFVGTPAYMSPEQAAMSGEDLDTRTDVYALGVLLYELLSGAPPFDPKELRLAAFDEICRKVREEEPPRPSTRVGSLGEEATTSARNRMTEPATLVRQLRGDLDWIVMKALEKDRERRYASPHDLAADLARHLAHEPVVAGPPSATYRARKFVRRHRVGVIAASAVLVAILAGAAAATVGFVRARRAEAEARRQAETAERVSDFLVELFGAAEPNRAGGRAISARDVVDEGARKLETELRSEPAIRARILETIGRVYRNLGDLGRSESLLREAIALEERRGDPHRIALATVHLGYVLFHQGRYDDAEGCGLRSLAVWTTGTAASPRWEGEALYLLGIVDRSRGAMERAEGRLQRSWDLLDGASDLDVSDRFAVGVELALVRKQRGHADEFVPRLEALLAEMREHGRGDAPMALVAERLIAWDLFARQGRPEEGERRCRDVLERLRSTGGDTQFVTDVLETLALMLDRQRKYLDALPVRRDLVETYEKVYGAAHRWTRVARLWEAWTLRRAGRREEAAGRALALWREVDRNDSPADLRAATGCYAGLGARWTGDEARARTMLAEWISALERAVPETDSALVRDSFRELAAEASVSGRLSESVEFLRKAIARGFRDPGLGSDPEFAAIRDHPEFAALVAEAGGTRP